LEIGQWLRALGLQSYEQAFRDNGIDLEVLRHLTVDDLKEIGVHAVGHRRKILEAISILPLEQTAVGAPASVERRQLTILFVDLVGSVDLSRRVDPEELREIMRAYQNAVAGEIARLEGHVAKFLGDGVLAYFGWPRASEDTAERAVRAGLAVATAVGDMSAGAGIPMAARVGIATGLVVVGDLLGEGAAKEEAVTGETPNLAARLQQVAEPNAVVIADSTRRLIGDLFELVELGALELKGFAKPVPAWRVRGEGRAESRFEALHGANVTPLVGRGEELDLILSRWRLAEERAGQIILILGEPGIGKSRLVLALRERLQSEPITLVSYSCSPQHSNSPLFPFVSQLEREARLVPEDAPEARLQRLELLFCESGERLSDDAIPVIAGLLGIKSVTPRALPDMSPQQRKALLFRTFLARLDRLAARGPVLMVLEDAHWLDPTSRELFDQIVDRVQRLPVLLIVTFRPELSPPWIGFPHVTLLTLNRLPQTQVVALVNRITGGRALPAEVLGQIVARTEGVPLFTEELTKAVLESGILRDAGDRYVLTGLLPSLAIPTTLHDSLMARLDRLAPVKQVAQIGACIGREFDYELLAVVVSMPEAELATALDRLVAAELVFQRGLPPAATYVFKHALVRDAAYESLLKRRRQDLHARIAMAIEARFPQLVEAQPELIARHFGEAGLAGQAIPYLLRAGRLATARSANMEAIAHLRSGLDCAEALGPGAPRPRFELSLQLALAASLIATNGFASSEAEAAFQRAQALSRELQSEADLFAALRGLGHVYHVRGNLPAATSLVEEVAALAKRSPDPELHAEADHFAGVVSFHLGEFQRSRDWLQISAETGENRGGYHFEFYGIDRRVFRCAYIGHCDWHLGYPAGSLKFAEEGLTLAREVSRPFTIALALSYLAMLHQFRREPDAALDAAAEACDICVQYRFDYYGAWSSLVRAWAIAESCDLDKGLNAYNAALEEFRRTGAGVRISHHLGLLATLHGKAGRALVGLRLIDEAVALAKANGETWRNAELHRERGELLLLASGHDAETQADGEFEVAIETAAGQGAKMPQLRASVARARLQAARGKMQQARDILTPIYAWFAEGFQTRDLVEARSLLADLL
jgi:class 3 adenylate cyclase/tetratricopeptide (TPR) repeat protein